MQSGRAALPVEGGTRPDAVRHALALVRARLDGDGLALVPVDPRSPAPRAGPAPTAAPGTVPPRAAGTLPPGTAGTLPPGTAVVLPTSGSSGPPRRVALTADALVAAANACHQRLGGPGRWLLALPTHHVAGFQVLVRSAVAGTDPVVLDTSAGFDAAALPSAVAALGTGYTSLVPTQLLRCLAHAGASAALATLDAVLVGGAALPAHVRERAEAAGIRVVETYGSTETGGGCVYDGVPLQGVEVALMGSAASTDRQGRIELAGPVLAAGYVDDAGALGPGDAGALIPDDAEDPAHDRGTHSTTDRGAFVRRDGRLWVRMPDLGRLDDDGRLTVLGRADDVVVTGGVKVHPAAVEDVLLALDGVAEAAVVGLPDPEWGASVTALVVPDPRRGPPTLASVRDAVGRRLGRAHAPRALAVVDALPRLGPGKLDRAGAARLAAAILTGPAAGPRREPTDDR